MTLYRDAFDRAESSFVSGTCNRSLLYRTVDGVLKAAVSAGRLATRAGGSLQRSVRYSFAELDAEVERVARGLMACGLKPGERVGIWAPNCAEWLLTMFAAARSGLILVNINPAYRTTELEFALKLVGCRALIFASQIKSSDYAQMLEIADSGTRVRRPRMPVVGTLPGAQAPGADWTMSRSGGSLSFRGSEGAGNDRGSGACLDSIERGLDADEVFNIQFTSGTTGMPKGAALTHFNIVNNGFFVGEGMRLTCDDRVCIPVPLYHCFGMVLGVLAAMTHGAASVLPVRCI